MSLPIIGSIVREAIGAADDLFTSDEERQAAELRLTQELNRPHILQALTNIQEAKHPSTFVAGWRPAIGWVCAAALAWHYMVRDFVVIALVAMVRDDIVPLLPQLDMMQVIGLITALLGLGASRTVEKLRGVHRERIKG